MTAVSESAIDGFNLASRLPVVPNPTRLTGDFFDVVCPADGSLLGSCLDSGAEGARIAVDAADEAFKSGVWSALDRAERARVLNRFADRIDVEIGGLAELDALQTGRPIREMRAQVGRISEWFRYFAALALTYESSVLPFPGEYHAYVEEGPIGPVGLITPWNHPLLILVKKLAAALAAGNTCVAKPSELTPLSSLVLADLALESGIPEGVFNVIPGAGDVGAAIAGDARLARIDFTGGTTTGRAVAALAAQALTPATLELGGKAPVLIFEDADLDAAINGALFAAFIASGQTCVAGTRILVHESRIEEVTKRMAQRADSIKVGMPLDETTQMGPLASSRQLDGVRGAVERALSDGADRVTTRTESDLGAELVVPLLAQGETLGAAVLVRAPSGQPFSDAEAQRARLLVDMAALVLQRMGHFDEVRRQEQAMQETAAELRVLTESLERKVQERTLRIQELARELTLAEQRERRAIAQILHDDLQQVLFGLQLNLRLLETRYAVLDEAALTEAFGSVHDLLGEAILSTRGLTVDLSPPILPEEGIVEALDWLAAHMHQRFGLTVEVRAAGSAPAASEEMLSLLFQTVRELLFNVVKHARTDQAFVVVYEEAGALVIEVRDEGVGFDPDGVELGDGRALGGFGLRRARERLGLFGGRAEVASTPGGGTRASVSLPLARLHYEDDAFEADPYVADSSV